MCAAANAAIDFMIDNNLAHEAQQKGEWFRKKLEQQQLPKVRQIRQMGLMIGIELNCPAAPVMKQMMDRGFLVGTAGTDVVRLLPPLVIEREDLRCVLDTLQEVLMG